MDKNKPIKKKHKERLPRKKSLKSVRKSLDTYWSAKIRERVLVEYGKLCCEKCSSNSFLQAHHIFGKKAHPGGRYIIQNGLLLCAGCHFDAHHRYEGAFRIWLVGTIGGEDALFKLHLRAMELLRLRPDDEDFLKEIMDAEIKKEKERVSTKQKSFI